MRRMKKLITSILIFGSSAYAVSTELSDTSIFNIQSKWKDQKGNEFQLKNLSGKPFFIAMVYLGCKQSCPLLTKKLRDVEEKLGSSRAKDFYFVMVSFDPKRDTPEALNKYFIKNKLKENWILLTAQDSSVRELAAVLGVNYKEDSSGEFSHSNIITYLDEKGEIKTQIKNLNEDLDKLVNAAK